MIIMDTDTGRYFENEFGAFEEEVLNAEWQPQPQLQLGLQESVSSGKAQAQPPEDLEAYLRTIYLSQE
jgi:hypothetical protein